MSRRRARNAYSLLEVVMASAICATALVPALAFMRDGMTLAETIDTRHLLLVYGVQTMEEYMPKVAALGDDWGADTDSGSVGYANIRYSLSWTDDPASGGLTNRLMRITVTTYRDENGNGVMDASEKRTTLTTKVGNLQSYKNKASS